MPQVHIQMTVRGSSFRGIVRIELEWHRTIGLLQVCMSKNKEPSFKEPLLGAREQLFMLRAKESRRTELDIAVIFSSYSPGEQLIMRCRKVDKAQKNILPSLAAVHNQLEFAFTMPDEEPSQPWNVFRKAISFAKLKQDLLHEDQEMYVAKPISNRCMICRCPIEDYYQHINTPAHLTAQNQNHATGYIKGLCGKFIQQRRNSFLEENSSSLTERADKSDRTQVLEEIAEDHGRKDQQ